MIKFNNTAVMNFENAMRGARNPLNSWARSDSSYDENGNFVFGLNDLDLAKRLCQAGNDHRKFIRQIFISVDITAPIYWWKEYDTYKVGTVANSTSTMHKIHSKPFELADFSTDHMTDEALDTMKVMVESLEEIRLKYMETKDKALWYSLIQLLPESYHQMRTCTMSYENAIAMYNARHNHKLEEWHTFCDWVCELPYFMELFPFIKDGKQAE
ncbi:MULTISPECIES: hypothetical protein [Clostridia]|jgi:hypothetical protein|uniref:Uncharacterized protein n=1 Tax=Butyribacter intestini TaxID=1703332 RepID=A0AAW3JVI6_9FIRM|nr:MULTISPECIES: hypothetical protein [Clostridia]KQC86510.1 hypothetical protein APZ18_04830 [Butyribacter intestini]RHP23285.1 hypothetical protein DWZ63_12730 [Clostridium sp. AF34-13]RHU77614.1 hypothetical protein DXC30_04915 [Butyribacter intestini]